MIEFIALHLFDFHIIDGSFHQPIRKVPLLEAFDLLKQERSDLVETLVFPRFRGEEMNGVIFHQDQT